MHINLFPLKSKCFWKCLNCKLPPAQTLDTIKETIKNSPKNTIDIYSHTTLNFTNSSELISYSQNHNHSSAIIWHDNIESLKLTNKPTFIIFPLFSTRPEIHNNFTNSTSFYKIISTINHMDKKQKKIILFSVNKDNFSDLADLEGLADTLKTNFWVNPYNLFSDNDYNKEDLDYLEYINKYKHVFINPTHIRLLRKKATNNNTCYLLRNDHHPSGIIETTKNNSFYSKLFK